jgi:hypothetical protein
MQSRTALFRIGYTSHIASYTDRGLDNFGWAEHPADLPGGNKRCFIKPKDKPLIGFGGAQYF